MTYMTVAEAAKKRGVTPRSVQIHCVKGVKDIEIGTEAAANLKNRFHIGSSRGTVAG